jgi:hypothetical protein
MIVEAIALVALAQGGQGGATQVNPGMIISQMIKKYNEATTLVGTILLKVEIAGQSTAVRTELQYEKPAKLYIKQSSGGRTSRTWYVTSDGKEFSYPTPYRPLLNDKQQQGSEPVSRPDGSRQDIRTIYSAAVEGLGDKSLPLDVAIGRQSDLVLLRDQLASAEYQGVRLVAGVEAHIISGKWRSNATAHTTGIYTMAISKTDDLLYYAISEYMMLDKGAQHELMTEWTVDFKVNVPVDQRLFKVVK